MLWLQDMPHTSSLVQYLRSRSSESEKAEVHWSSTFLEIQQRFHPEVASVPSTDSGSPKGLTLGFRV